VTSPVDAEQQLLALEQDALHVERMRRILHDWPS
jgi:hypothetical protein